MLMRHTSVCLARAFIWHIRERLHPVSISYSAQLGAARPRLISSSGTRPCRSAFFICFAACLACAFSAKRCCYNALICQLTLSHGWATSVEVVAVFLSPFAVPGPIAAPWRSPTAGTWPCKLCTFPEAEASPSGTTPKAHRSQRGSDESPGNT